MLTPIRRRDAATAWSTARGAAQRRAHPACRRAAVAPRSSVAAVFLFLNERGSGSGSRPVAGASCSCCSAAPGGASSGSLDDVFSSARAGSCWAARAGGVRGGAGIDIEIINDPFGRRRHPLRGPARRRVHGVLDRRDDQQHQLHRRTRRTLVRDGVDRGGDARADQPDPAGVGQPLVAVMCFALGRGAVRLPALELPPGGRVQRHSGDEFIGYSLAVLSILGTAKVAVALLVLGVPIIDTFWIIVRRLANRRSPFSPDRGHIHHRLLDLGLTHMQTVLLIYVICAVLGLLSCVRFWRASSTRSWAWSSCSGSSVRATSTPGAGGSRRTPTRTAGGARRLHFDGEAMPRSAQRTLARLNPHAEICERDPELATAVVLIAADGRRGDHRAQRARSPSRPAGPTGRPSTSPSAPPRWMRTSCSAGGWTAVRHC